MSERSARDTTRAEVAARAKFIKAAMPIPNCHAQALKALQLSHRDSSPNSNRRSPQRSPGVAYPWEMRITPPPAKLELALPPAPTIDFETALRIRERKRMAAFVAKAAAIRAAAQAKREAEDAAKRAAAASTSPNTEKGRTSRSPSPGSARSPSLVRQQSQLLLSAGKAAAAEASAQATKTVGDLEEMREHCKAKRAEFQQVLTEMAAGKQATLKRKLGEAILELNVPVNDLMLQWDKNKNGSLSMIEFKQAVRVSLQLKVSNDEIDELFRSFDDDGGGTLSVDELRPAIKRLHDFWSAPAFAPGVKLVPSRRVL